MGYPMAKNLRNGLDSAKTLLICDVSKDALNRFQAETAGKGPVEIVENGFEAARAAVSCHHQGQVKDFWSIAAHNSPAHLTRTRSSPCSPTPTQSRRST